MRNFTNEPISIKIVSLQDITNNFDGLEIYWTKGIYKIDTRTLIPYPDTSKVKIIDSSIGIFELPGNSTSEVQLPYRWRTKKYLIIAVRENGQTDTLNHEYNKIKKEKSIERHNFFHRDLIYYDFN